MKVAVRHNGLDGTKHPNPMAWLGLPFKLAMCDYLFGHGVKRCPEDKVRKPNHPESLPLSGKK